MFAWLCFVAVLHDDDDDLHVVRQCVNTPCFGFAFPYVLDFRVC